MKKNSIAIVSVLLLLMCLGISKGYSAEIETKAFSTTDIEMIKINLTDWDVDLQQSNDSNINVTADGFNDKDGTKAKLVNGVLKMAQGKAKSGLFGGFTFKDNSKLKIEIPASYVGKLKISSHSGDIQVKNMKIGNANIQSTTGDIYLKNIAINEASKVVSAKGDVDLSFSDKPKNLKINYKAKAVDNEKAQYNFGKASTIFEVDCPEGTLSIY